MLPAVPDDELGTLVVPGVVPKLSLTPGEIRRTGGAIGRDTREVLRQCTALGEDEIDALVASGVVRQASGQPPTDEPAGPAG
jgi:crotonobetainyl-CoA:carnitine CoA-transferase CaiB-like acyl-CoA transferase